MQVPAAHVRVGRVLMEDDQSVVIEVPKDMSRELRLEEGDRFLTLMFVHNVDGAYQTWLPWL